jgi:hypothetical protein
MGLVLLHRVPGEHHLVRVTLGSAEARLPQRRLQEGPWLLADGSSGALRAALLERHPLLGSRFACQLGVKTGLNPVYLHPAVDLEPALCRWGVRGRDIRPFGVRGVTQLFWPCDPRGAPLAALPPAAERFVRPHLPALRRRVDYRGGPPWVLFRTAPAVAAHRVVWADLARRLEAAPLTGARDAGLIPLNTCYVIAVPDRATALRLAAWLNSTWCRLLARASADPARNGFARFNARVIAGLPLPGAVLESVPLLRLAEAACAGALRQEPLDACCAGLLGLSPDDCELLAQSAG